MAEIEATHERSLHTEVSRAVRGERERIKTLFDLMRASIISYITLQERNSPTQHVRDEALKMFADLERDLLTPPQGDGK